MPKRVCPTCGRIVDYEHVCPNRAKDTRKKNINTDSRWPKIRQEVKERDLSCRLCWSQGIYSPIEECHHIIARESCDEDQVFDVTNCIGLCRECHHKVHRDGWQKYTDLFKGMIDHD